jgi:long-chain acyl-CoA synthetase
MSKADYQVPDSRPWFKLYGTNIEKHLDYPDVPLYDFLDKAAANHPENIAMSFYGKNITYREYGELVNKFCRALLVNGIQKGDRVIIMAVNCPQTIIAHMGVMKAGAIPVPLNPLYTPKELEYFFKDLNPRIVVTLDNFYGNVSLAAKVTPQIEKIISTNISDYFPPLKGFLARALKKVEVFNCHEAIDFKDFIEMATRYDSKDNIKKEEDLSRVKINPKEDIALIVYTGGTTGEPKGVALTHSNIIANVMAIEEWFKNTAVDSLLLVVPLFHIYGSGPIINFCHAGARKLLILPKFHTKETIKALQKEKVNGLFCVPAIYSAFVKYYQEHPKEPKLKDVTFCGSGSTSISSYTWKNLEKIIPNAYVVEGYGLSESCPALIIDPADKNYVKDFGSVGVPYSDTDAKIVDLKTGEDLLPDCSGEIILKGPSIFKEYWNKPEKTKQVLRDGWFYTGDIGHMSKQGVFYIEGRKDDMINVRGEKVWPREVEQVLEQHYKILDVAVIGVQSDYYGQAVKACVVLKPGETATEQELIEYCKGSLVSHKVPVMIEFFNELPKSNIGKTLHSVLRKRESDKK